MVQYPGYNLLHNSISPEIDTSLSLYSGMDGSGGAASANNSSDFVSQMRLSVSAGYANNLTGAQTVQVSASSTMTNTKTTDLRDEH